MSLEELKRIVPPPVAPLERGRPADWQAVEEDLGTPLPDDFKHLIATYGAGSFDDFLYVYNPFAGNQYLNLLRQKELNLTAYTAARKDTPDLLPFPPYPEPGGLLPWAGADNGDRLYWQTVGQPDTWPIVLFDGDHVRHEVYPLRVSDWLAQVMVGTLKPRIFPEDFWEEDEQYFEPLA